LATIIDAIWQYGLDFFQIYVLPYLIVLAIALLSVLFAFGLSNRYKKLMAKRSLVAELRTNAKVTKDIVAYADGQLSGELSVAPMPRYQTRAFLHYTRMGMGTKLSPKVKEELQSLYLSKRSVNDAGRRQEELAFGPAAAFPNAHTLRLENLTYLRDTAHNVIEPYLDRLKATKI
jgi:hypothetical protein